MKILGLSSADLVDSSKISAAYKIASKKNHPDLGGDAEEMKKVNAAYKRLGSGKKDSSSDFGISNMEESNKKHDALATFIMKDMLEKYSPNIFATYFSDIIGQPFSFEVDNKIHKAYYDRSVVFSTEFFNNDKSTIISLRYSVSTSNLDTRVPLLSISGVELNTYVSSEILHNRRKIKMKQSNWEFSKDGDIFKKPEKLFPKKKLEKMIKSEQKTLKPADFKLALKKELGMHTQGNDYYAIPLKDGMKLLMYRVTMMRKGLWMFNGIYDMHKRVQMAPHISYYENGQTLDFLIDNLKSLKRVKDAKIIFKKLEDMGKDYKKNLVPHMK
jgi:curved DNA-binding protein CbpA